MKRYKFEDAGCYIKAGDRCLGMSHGDADSRREARQLIAQANAAIDLLAACKELAQFAANEVGVPLGECVAGPIGKAQAAIAAAEGTGG